MEKLSDFDKVMIEGITKSIENMLGGELSWTEKAALKNYYRSYERNYYVTKKMFLLDYFDLNYDDLRGVWIHLNAIGELKDVIYRHNLVKDKKFKEYCRERVQMWRDERTLC